MRTRKGDQAATAAAAATKATAASTPRAAKSTTVAKRTSSTPIAPSISAEELRAGAPLSPAIRLPVLATMGLAISTVLHQLATQFGDGGVGHVARRAEGWGELGVVVGWRSIELGIAWCNGYSASEVAALSLFSQGPVLFLLHYFYNTRATPTILSLVITILSTTLPIALIPPPKTRRTTAEAPEIDGGAKILTTLLAACIHSLVLSISYATFLPTTLATQFNNLPSVAAAHSSSFISLLPLTLVSGLAARSFILAPSTSSLSTTKPEFDAVSSGLGEHVRYNVCGYSERMKEVLRRTAILASLGGANTFALVKGIEGVEACGAVAYAGVWVTAVVVSGVALGVVGDVDV
ncbi:hypothetical protein VE01_00920 [Pseudogymnoascus verrucosus]|uniref:Uncharacterized protein n=1 Tax=Pseudogymnoascus verrucosus TaxID=342668 RepID=A0A2P2SWL6_9PEZI|nr:uncharacterized protein VE01_00920 [Pseudogymnoascus verrucosus]OBU01200.1 hypothetical protein VE01_00920 [Pseudogymnoascus verrucosus]